VIRKPQSAIDIRMAKAGGVPRQGWPQYSLSFRTRGFDQTGSRDAHFYSKNCRESECYFVDNKLVTNGACRFSIGRARAPLTTMLSAADIRRAGDREEIVVPFLSFGEGARSVSFERRSSLLIR